MVSGELESDSYTVNENEGTVEVCLVKTRETTQSISVDITAGESSPVDAVGMLLLPITYTGLSCWWLNYSFLFHRW